MSNNKKYNLLGVALSVATFSFSLSAQAVQWDITPRISLKEVYSDNIDLSDGDEEDDFITDISPGINIIGKGRRVELDFDYSLQNLIFADNTENNSSNHRLRANSDIELVENRLFLDLASSISQQLGNRRNAASADAISGSNNLNDVYTYSIAPTWRERLGGYSDLTVTYTFDSVDTDPNDGGSSDSDSEANAVRVSLKSGPEITRFFWDFNFNQRDVDYSDSDETETELMTGQIGVNINRNYSVFVTATEEDNEFVGDRGNLQPDDSYYGVGATWTPNPRFSLTAVINKRDDTSTNQDEHFGTGELSWQPTPRTDFQLSYGNRFFGENYNGRFTHRMRKIEWYISYNEGTSDFRQQALSARFAGSVDCPPSAFVGGLPILSQCQQADFNNPPAPGTIRQNLATLEASVSNDTFINESAQVGVTITGRRNTIDLRVTDGQREFLADRENEQDFAVRINWSLQIGPRTSSDFAVNFTEREFDDGDQDDFTELRWQLNRTIARDATLSFLVSHSSRQGDGSARDYDENRLEVRFVKRF